MLNNLRNTVKDKYFWIFEAATLIHTTLIILFVVIPFCNNAPTFLNLLPIIAVVQAINILCGLITWQLARGYHWIIFCSIYECLLILFYLISAWISSLFTSNGFVFHWPDPYDAAFLIVLLLFFTTIPTIILTLIAYRPIYYRLDD